MIRIPICVTHVCVILIPDGSVSMISVLENTSIPKKNRMNITRNTFIMTMIRMIRMIYHFKTQ